MPNITIGGQAWPVYALLATANTYLKAASHGDPWFAVSSGDRNQLLVTASRVFERTGWQGNPTEPIDKSDVVTQPPGTQPLAWPRIGLIDREGVPVPETSIPGDVVAGNIEYALTLLVDPSVQTDDVRGSNLKVDKLTNRVEGAVTQTTEKQYFRPTIGALPAFSPTVQDYIGLWLAGAQPGTFGFASGTDVDPVLTEESLDFGFTGGGVEG